MRTPDHRHYVVVVLEGQPRILRRVVLTGAYRPRTPVYEPYLIVDGDYPGDGIDQAQRIADHLNQDYEEGLL